MLNKFLLVLTAAIWGFAFVAQRLGMQSLDPLSFNAIRFAMGALFVWMVAGWRTKQDKRFPVLPGLVLFIAATLQQVGVVYTSAGAAGFITGLYVVFVPLLGIRKGQKLTRRVIVAVLLSLAGMLLINDAADLKLGLGNILVLLSAVFFAIHVQLIGFYSKQHPAANLAFAQYAVCALLSLVGFIIYGLIKSPAYLISASLTADISQAFWPLLYGGIMSVGVAYSLQVKAQQKANPSTAAVILCLEGVFALFGGWLILGEKLGARQLFGSGLMLVAMLICIFPFFLIDRNRA